MKEHNRRYGDQLRDPVASFQDTDIFQAVNNQKSENCRRKRSSQILYVPRRFFPRRKQKKGKKSCKHGSQDHRRYCNDLLCYSHLDPSSLFSTGFLNSVSIISMAAMEGIMKLSAPNIHRQSREIPRPRRALMCCRSFSHCSKKITVNMAVITKSSPSVLK